MGLNQNVWCKYQRIKGHTIDDRIHLKREIEKLIQDGKLRGYVKGKHGEEGRRPEEPTKDIRDDTNGDHKERHNLNTISGGFAREGGSSYSQIRYLRQVMTQMTPEANNTQVFYVFFSHLN